MIPDDEIVVVFCNPVTAKELIEEEPDMEDTLIPCAMIPQEDVIVVKEKDFLDWLYERREE